MAKRLNDKQKAKKLAKYNQLRESGKTARQAAKLVGVTYATLLKWEKGGGKPGKGTRKTKARVSRKVAAAPARVTLVTPDGFRIEADDLKDIVVVLKGLR